MNKRPPLKPHLLKYINSKEGWIHKVDLYPVGAELEFGAEYVGRELRKLVEEEKISVSYYDGKWAKGLAKYSRKDYQPKQLKLVESFREDGTRIMILQ